MVSNPVRLTAALLGALLLGIGAVIVSCGGSMQRSPLIGRIAPPLEGQPLAGGQSVDLDDHRGRWVVLNFFAPWCTACLVEHPELQSFARRHSIPDDARVVSVVVDSTGREARAFLERHPPEWTFVLDRDGAVGVAYGRGKVPETYLIAPNGVVAAKFEGGVTADELDGAIRAGAFAG